MCALVPLNRNAELETCVAAASNTCGDMLFMIRGTLALVFPHNQHAWESSYALALADPYQVQKIVPTSYA